MLVRDVMTPNVVTLKHNDSLRSADDLMKTGRIRHLPVLDDDGKLAGILSQRDVFHSGLLRALGYGSHAKAQALASLLVKEAMHTDVRTIRPDAPLADAASALLEHRIGCLVVVQGDRVAGILTESDFVKLAAGRQPST
jgi:CBS domain-containing membrane protein